jgi:hypothetical protein
LYKEKKWAVVERNINDVDKQYNLIGRPFERAGGGLSKERLTEIFKEVLV